MRKGIYAMYKGKEFRAFSMDNGMHELVSYDFEDHFRGFNQATDCAYCKQVKHEELEELYQVRTMAEYRNKRYLVLMEKVDSILVVDEDGSKPDIRPRGINKLDFENSVWLPKRKSTRLYVEKDPIPSAAPAAIVVTEQLRKTS